MVLDSHHLYFLIARQRRHSFCFVLRLRPFDLPRTWSNPALHVGHLWSPSHAAAQLALSMAMVLSTCNGVAALPSVFGQPSPNDAALTQSPYRYNIMARLLWVVA